LPHSEWKLPVTAELPVPVALPEPVQNRIAAKTSGSQAFPSIIEGALWAWQH